MKSLGFLAFTLGMASIVSQASAAHSATRPTVAPSPTAAVESAIAAMVDGDEQAFRRSVLIRSADGYLDAYFRRLFAAARLHSAIIECRVKGVRVRADADVWDRDETLPVCVPAPKGWLPLLQEAKRLK